MGIPDRWQTRKLMHMTLLRTTVLVLGLGLGSSALAADVAPLELTPAEGLTYWTPAPGTFTPRMTTDPKRVAYAEEVILAYTITKRGRTTDVQVIEAKPAGAYAGWAVDAIKAMRFEPTQNNAARTPIRSQLTSRWTAPASK
jgi:TonB family protein